jgi:hypothetical protein
MIHRMRTGNGARPFWMRTVFIVSRVGVTYRRGFWLDNWIYWHLIQNTRNYRQLQRSRWSTHFTVHRYTRARILSLHLSYPGNGIIIVSLSLRNTHGIFFSQPNFFLCNYSEIANSEDSTQFNSSAPKLISWQVGVSKLNSSRHYYCSLLPNTFYNHFARTTQKTTSVVMIACFLIRCLAVDDPLLRSLAPAGMCLPSRCQAMGIRVTIWQIFVFVRCTKWANAGEVVSAPPFLCLVSGAK